MAPQLQAQACQTSPTPDQQDPAIIVIQPPPTPPPQSLSIPSSLPSLESIPSVVENDSDIEILSFIPPKGNRNRITYTRPDMDPVAQIAAGAQNLLL